MLRLQKILSSLSADWTYCPSSIRFMHGTKAKIPSHGCLILMLRWPPSAALEFHLSTTRPFRTSVNRKTFVQQSLSMGQLPTTGLCVDEVWYVSERLLIFSRDLKLEIEGQYDTVLALWTWIRWIMDHNDHVSDINLLERYVHLLTAAGFALPTEFPAHPLGQMVSRHAKP